MREIPSDYGRVVVASQSELFGEALKITLGARQGSYPGMATERIFRVAWMKPGQAEGSGTTEVRYDGSEITLAAPALVNFSPHRRRAK